MAGERKAAGGANAIPRLEAARGPSEADALAFLLRTVNPRVDAEAVAGRLLERFGHLSDVFDAPAELLAAVPGVSARMAGLIAVFPALFRLYIESKQTVRERITDTQMAFHAVQSKFFSRRTEIVVLLILDSKGYLKYMDVVNEGSVRGVPLYIRELVRLCLLYDADTIYLAHNHPSGNCTPSGRDIKSTNEIDTVLHGIGVHLADHFIFADDDYVSMRASGILQKLRNDRIMQKNAAERKP